MSVRTVWIDSLRELGAASAEYAVAIAVLQELLGTEAEMTDSQRVSQLRIAEDQINHWQMRVAESAAIEINLRRLAGESHTLVERNRGGRDDA